MKIIIKMKIWNEILMKVILMKWNNNININNDK